MRRKRRNHFLGLKTKVALVAIKGDKTLAQLAEHCSVVVTMGQVVYADSGN